MRVASYCANRVLNDDCERSEIRHPVTHGVHSRLRVPADLTAVSSVRSALACMLTRGEWSPGASARVPLASTEALTNAIEPGSEPGASVQVALFVGPDRADVVVVDEGRPGGRLPRVPETPPPPAATRGRGLIIMSRLADDLDLRPHAHGTEVSIRFIRVDADDGGRAGDPPDRAAATA